MAECRCGTCEHCNGDSGARVGHAVDDELTSHAPPTPRNDKPRRLLTWSELADIRATWAGAEDVDVARLLDAYETAVHMLEACVRAPDPATSMLGPSDIAWLALREAER